MQYVSESGAVFGFSNSVSPAVVIHALPALADNYMWLIHNHKDAIIIDPTLATPVAEFLAANSLTLRAILLTHAHHDHIGGVAQLCAKFAPQVYDNFNEQLRDGSLIQIPGFAAFQVLLTPGHTFEHVCYLFAKQHLFCGDTLFTLGCGRVFTNDYELMFRSLVKLQRLGDEVCCYPAHEYTLKNLEFTLSLDPDQDYYKGYAKSESSKIWYQQSTAMCLSPAEVYSSGRQLDNGRLPNSVPSSLAAEKKYNLFLRCHQLYIQQLVAVNSQKVITNPLECFVALRQLRNIF